MNNAVGNGRFEFCEQVGIAAPTDCESFSSGKLDGLPRDSEASLRLPFLDILHNPKSQPQTRQEASFQTRFSRLTRYSQKEKEKEKIACRGDVSDRSTRFQLSYQANTTFRWLVPAAHDLHAWQYNAKIRYSRVLTQPGHLCMSIMIVIINQFLFAFAAAGLGNREFKSK